DRARLAGPDLASCLGQLDEHEVAELRLRVVGDAYGDGAVGLAAQPLVARGVAQLRWDVHRFSRDRNRTMKSLSCAWPSTRIACCSRPTDRETRAPCARLARA